MSQLYKVARGVVKRPRDPKSPRVFSTAADFIGQGETIPEGMIAEAEMATLLELGIVEPIEASSPEADPAKSVKRGKWSVDPASLVNKDLEALVVMILELDPDHKLDGIDTVPAAVAQLTADWNPVFRDAITRSTDRSRAEHMGTGGMKDAGSKPMSDEARAVLERAKAQAQQPAPLTLKN